MRHSRSMTRRARCSALGYPDKRAKVEAVASSQLRLKQFFGKVGGFAHDVAIDVLAKYLESEGL
jgi:hypothetical protein